MEEARHCKARSATLARSSSEKLGAVLQRDIIIVINVLTQRGLIVLVSRFISPSRWIVKSLTKRDIYIKKKKYKKTRSYLEPILLRTPLSILRVTNNHGIRNDRIEEEEEEEGCLIFVSTRNNFTRMMIGGVWKGRDDHFLSLRPLSTRARKKGGGKERLGENSQGTPCISSRQRPSTKLAVRPQQGYSQSARCIGPCLVRESLSLRFAPT